MKTRQITLPFRRRSNELTANANCELIGRSYRQDRYVYVTIIDVCADDPARVLVERNVDRRTWTMPGWLVRLILLQERRRAA